MSNKVNLRLKKFLKSQGITQETFCEAIGLSVNTLKTTFQRGSDISLDSLSNTISRYPHLNIEWLIAGEGEMLKSEKELPSIIYPARPLVENMQAVCGKPNGFSSAIMKNGHKMISLPANTDYDFAIEATGLSMINKNNPEQTINPGDLIALKIITSPSYIKWGELYAIATLDDIVIKKLMPSDLDNHIKCVSFNEDEFPAYDIPVNEITGWALVKAVVGVLKF